MNASQRFWTDWRAIRKLIPGANRTITSCLPTIRSEPAQRYNSDLCIARFWAQEDRNMNVCCLALTLLAVAVPRSSVTTPLQNVAVRQILASSTGENAEALSSRITNYPSAGRSISQGSKSRPHQFCLAASRLDIWIRYSVADTSYQGCCPLP